MKSSLQVLALGFIGALCLAGNACRTPSSSVNGVIVRDHPALSLSQPRALAENLANPTAVIAHDGALLFSEGGAGTVNRLGRSGDLEPLIHGFGSDIYAGYEISAQGIAVDPGSGRWIVCAAEGPGKALVFDPSDFPVSASRGIEIPLEGAVDDNPWEALVLRDPPWILVSSGTSKSYQGPLDVINPAPLQAVFEVPTGLIGIALDPVSGDAFGAVFGPPAEGGFIIRWNPRENASQYGTVAKGFRNLVDVAFLADGTLLALEFGEFGEPRSGSVSVVSGEEGEMQAAPVIEGLDSPSSMFVDADGSRLLITEYGPEINGGKGALLSFGIR